MKKDKRSLKKQASNFGLNIYDFTKHGAYSYLRFGTHKCKNCILKASKKCDLYGQEIEYKGEIFTVGLDTECPIIEAYVEDTVSKIMKLTHIREQDIITANQLARALGFIAIANKYLNEMGVFRVKGNVVDTQPLINSIVKYENLIAKLSDSLGLNPRARANLKLDKSTLPLSGMILQSKGKKE